MMGRWVDFSLMGRGRKRLTATATRAMAIHIAIRRNFIFAERDG
jgi:hypothetical protein